MNERRTKIVATLGPSTSTPRQIEQLVKAGADVLRLNFSHGTLNEHARTIRIIRKLSHKLDRPIGILADLPGPKLRTGLLEGGKPVRLKQGSTITLTTRSIRGHAGLIPVMYKGLPKKVSVGDRILLADGVLELKVLRKTGNEISCRVMAGGELGNHKGINLPGLRLPIPSLTERDRAALKLVCRVGVDYIALSFVQRPSDVVQARRAIRRAGSKTPIIAKIEKPEALRHIDKIFKLVDGIMIARGDLGVEVPTEDVPVIQKELIRGAIEHRVPVITATQMLDSMIHNPLPTRAETTDVANAIWDGTDAVMLSGETAAGDYPIQAVRTMARIIEKAESHPIYQRLLPKTEERTEDASRTIISAARSVGKRGVHKAIVTYTKSGLTALSLSHLRPEVRVIALTPDEKTYQRLTLVWGVQVFHSPQGRTVEHMIHIGDRLLIRKAGLKRRDRIILVAGTQLRAGATNLLKIHELGDTLA